MTLDELEKRADAFESLMRHPGWQLLCEELRKQSEVQLSHMRGAQTSDALLRHTLTYMALTDLPKSPELFATLARQQLQRLLEKK